MYLLLPPLLIVNYKIPVQRIGDSLIFDGFVHVEEVISENPDWFGITHGDKKDVEMRTYKASQLHYEKEDMGGSVYITESPLDDWKRIRIGNNVIYIDDSEEFVENNWL